MKELRRTKTGYVVYRDQDFQFVVERGVAEYFNCLALIPAKDYTRLIDTDKVIERIRR